MPKMKTNRAAAKRFRSPAPAASAARKGGLQPRDAGEEHASASAVSARTTWSTSRSRSASSCMLPYG